MREATYQAKLVRRLRSKFKKLDDIAVVMPMDGNTIQGWPDILILADMGWCVLEVKTDAGADRQPNQEYWLEWCNDRCLFASLIWPHCEEQVLEELFQALGVGR